MTALDRLAAAEAPSARLVDTLARGLRRVSRRSFLVRTTLVGSALAVDPKGYLLTPASAYSRVCGPASSCSAGYTVFCCTVNKGVNACPPGTFTAGWWKAADSSWCCGGYRYIVDCNATCKSCRSGCGGDHICDSRCWNCSCKCGPSGSCDRRRVCCNAFRYGQCNTHVSCSGGVACRVVSCVPPYKWDNCTTTSLVDNATAEHNAPCLQGCGPILKKYNALGANGSYLGASTGPERSVGDGRGRYVTYQRGAIYWTKATGAHAVHGAALAAWREKGGARGRLGYPKRDRAEAKDGRGWVQLFQHGMVCDSPATRTQVVWGPAYEKWASVGRETGPLGYPALDRAEAKDGRGWVQRFEQGIVCDGPKTRTRAVWGPAFDRWAETGRETGPLGYPTRERGESRTGSGWVQRFQHGVICDGLKTDPHAVWGAAYERWAANGREAGPLGFPVAERRALGDGWLQRFQHGAVCDSVRTSTASVWGSAYQQWMDRGGHDGELGYPTADRVTATDGTWVQTFERGTLTG